MFEYKIGISILDTVTHLNNCGNPNETNDNSLLSCGVWLGFYCILLNI